MTHNDGGPAMAADEPTDRWENALQQLADRAAATREVARNAVLEHINTAAEIKRAQAAAAGTQPDALIDATAIIQAIRDDLNIWLDRIEPLR